MNTWLEAHQDYTDLIDSEEWDSRYLRERGVIPNVVEMVGHCAGKTVLDVGTGSGWLFKHLKPREAHAVDLVKSKSLPSYIKFKLEDASRLSYEDGYFDIVVASLLLMFCIDAEGVLRELYRVSKPRAALIISLVHPYFYRTGIARSDDSYLIRSNLKVKRSSKVKIGGTVGPLAYYYRPYPTYLNMIIRTGWQIAEARDWFLNSKDYNQYLGSGGKSKLRRSNKVPIYSFIRVEKGQ